MKMLLVVIFAAMTLAVQAHPTAFGCFVDRRWPELKDTPWKDLCAKMHGIGMNSVALYAYGPQDLAEQMDQGIEALLIQPDVPVIVVPNWSRTGDPDGSCWMLDEAKKLGVHTGYWPEMIEYGFDESQTVSIGHKDMYDTVQKDGYRLAAGCVYPFVVPRVPFLNVVLVATISGGGLERDKRTIEAYGGEYGNYLVIGTVPKKDPYDMMRYFCGIWSWKTKAEWAFVGDYRRVFGMDERWPGDTLSRGFADGVRDYERLQRVEWDFVPGVKAQ